ncbi:hypothetical protein I7I48_02436 [Histoplasma ohiense]|nr:hypothetical protein I7I48_02436 [Histoplasma ohiense (nom. inval.)]
MSSKRENSSSDSSDLSDTSASKASPVFCADPSGKSSFPSTLDTILENTVPLGPNHLFWSPEDRTGEKGCG